jgi:hypothetical protein
MSKDYHKYFNDCEFKNNSSEEKYEKLANADYPLLKQVYLNIKEAPFKCGDIRLLPKNTTVFVIDLQTNVSFVEDEIIEVTGVSYNGEYFIAKLKQAIGLLQCPTLIDKGISEIGTVFSKTQDYTLPKPVIMEYTITEN